jgi:hypothetical protein
MIAAEDPPSFVVRTEAQKAASDNGFRLERGSNGGWLGYASTTAPGMVWIAAASARGPWLISIDHGGVAAELSPAIAPPGMTSGMTLPVSGGGTALPIAGGAASPLMKAAPAPGPGLATFIFATLPGRQDGRRRAAWPSTWRIHIG